MFWAMARICDSGFTLGAELSELELSFTEPYFLDRQLAAGFDIFWTVNEQEESSFDERRLGGSLRGGYFLTENIRQVWRYTLEQQDITNVDDDASLVIQLDQGERVSSAISHELIYDTRDSRFDTREGFFLTTSNEFSGIGGDVRYLRNTVGGGYFHTFLENLTGSVRTEAGHIFGIDQDTLVSDRFFLGQDSLRGFEFAGVGPRDAVTDDALGGKNFYNGTVELSFPVFLPDEFQVRGRVFTDVGAVWDVDGVPSSVVVLDSSSPRVTVGAGFSWVSPFGPVIVDLGFPVVQEDFDKDELLSFSFGTRFLNAMAWGSNDMLAAAAGSVFLALVCFLLPASVQAQEGAGQGIAVIDAQQIFREAAAVVALQQEIDAKRKAFQQELNTKEKALRDADAELAGQRAILAAEAFAKKRKELETQVVALQNEVRTRRAALDKTFADGMTQVRSALVEVSQEISKEKSLYLVIEKSAVVLVRPELEITAEALKRLNARLPTVAPAAAQN